MARTAGRDALQRPARVLLDGVGVDIDDQAVPCQFGATGAVPASPTTQASVSLRANDPVRL
ncbi:MAG TPA: hypothetical protein VMG13_15360 [Trebonia sp.]|nr:hypothetical protein [Trebonia sp.]